jgi:hypothetical protein
MMGYSVSKEPFDLADFLSKASVSNSRKYPRRFAPRRFSEKQEPIPLPDDRTPPAP